jgi:DNA repair photolyase
MIKYTHKEFKTILNKRKFIDGWFWDRYGINGYNGCIFGCVYCDSRSSEYHLPTDFENDIIVKTNVKEMLDKRIGRPGNNSRDLHVLIRR